MNSRFDFVTIKHGLWTNSRLGFAEKNDGYETYVRNDVLLFVSRLRQIISLTNHDMTYSTG